MALLIDNRRVEFLGVEILFTQEDDPRGSVWVEFNESMSLLYGKNGAGKSTILDALTAFMEGRSLEDSGILVHGYARVLDATDSCSIIDQAVESMPKTRFLSEWEGLETTELSTKFEVIKRHLNLPHEKWESSLFGATPDSWNDLDMDWNKFVSHFVFLGLWENDHVHGLAPIKSLVQHLIGTRTLCLRAIGHDKNPEWHVSLAATLEHPEVRDAYEYLLRNPDVFFSDEFTETHASQILMNLNVLANRSDIPRTNSPYIPASGIAGQVISSIGLSVVNLSEEIDLHEWTKQRISEIVHTVWHPVDNYWFSDGSSELSPTSMFDVDNDLEEEIDGGDGESIWSATFGSRTTGLGRTLEFEFSGRRYEKMQEVLSFIAKELPEELAIADLRLTLESDLGLWIFDKPGSLEAFDNRSGTWIPVSSTSRATQKIIGMALKIHSDIRSSHQVAIAVGDEIDQGLHTLAVNGLYKMLADSVPACFVTTHSSIALSTKLGERLHVHRSAAGAILVSRISNLDFISLAASNFGVKIHELIGAVDLIVAVEGHHDKKVLEYFIDRDQRLAGHNILMISMMGVNNATNLIDAQFLLSFTDLRILVIADNTSRTELQESWSSTREQLKAGQLPSVLAKGLRDQAAELKKQRWHEQRCMIELLAAATEADLLSRLRIGGHIHSDIEMALDPKYFGLDREWSELEAEFREYKNDRSANGKNFKDFVRQRYGVKIDLSTIDTALSMTLEPPAQIKRILDDVVANVFQTDILQDFF